jgi:hypothetical protein
MSCAIFTVEDLLPGRTPRVGNVIPEIDPILLVRQGGDVIVADGGYSERKGLAERIARMAGTGSPIPFESGTIRHSQTKGAGAGSLEHFHPTDRFGRKTGGHVFIDNRHRGQSPFTSGRQ